MATAEEQYRKSLAQFGARLSDIEKKRLQCLYRIPLQYNELPSEAVLQALELLGVYSARRPEGVAELPGWLGMKNLQKDIKKRLRGSKEVKLNENFCLPLCDELYASVDLQRSIEAVQQQTKILKAHLELLKRIVTAKSTGSIAVYYSTAEEPGPLSEAVEKADQILQNLAEASSGHFDRSTGT